MTQKQLEEYQRAAAEMRSQLRAGFVEVERREALHAVEDGITLNQAILDLLRNRRR